MPTGPEGAQARRALSVADQDVACREGGVGRYSGLPPTLGVRSPPPALFRRFDYYHVIGGTALSTQRRKSPQTSIIPRLRPQSLTEVRRDLGLCPAG